MSHVKEVAASLFYVIRKDSYFILCRVIKKNLHEKIQAFHLFHLFLDCCWCFIFHGSSGMMSSGPKSGGRGVVVVVLVTWGSIRGKSCGRIFNSTIPE